MIPAAQAALDRVIQVRGVRGAMLVSAADGLIVAEISMTGVDSAAAAALAASLATKLQRAIDAAGLRPGEVMHLRGELGSVLIAPGGDELLLVAIADREANLGLARMELLNASRELA